MRLLLTCLLIALALPASAQIYKYTDAKGNTVFTNQPPEGIQAESVELPPTNTVEMQAPQLPASSPEPAPTQAAYRVLRLTDIPTDEALRANNGTFSVGVQIEPALAPSHRLRLVLDGRPYGEPRQAPPLQLSQIDRGEHSLAVQVLSGERIVQQSETLTFTVQRVNTSSPALRPPPPKPPTPPKPAN
ncbi:MAG: DUF4124 domain-containing protein [Gammaproteobacteria bacterium]|nr:DUF4124 domain-containing protein [Gammaproteobacteria bacterium]MBU1531263.1 DUF4124 domain-containing protein [Gammaproteobacteria bacterium]MBU2067334.1 DUF4124 domain-containing protein [Gammaproteobacteria bacterium]MBU2154744.1 DUF4124 domain-containing protein [Gammaproteobacteria bacterium]MBU2216568.1 DUF4124 domain-containing protein [Gammaproteobacteria bacterium]